MEITEAYEVLGDDKKRQVGGEGREGGKKGGREGGREGGKAVGDIKAGVNPRLLQM